VAGAADGPGVDVAAALVALGERGVLQALVEGGPTLAGAVVSAGLADRLVAYVAPTLLGRDAPVSLAVPGPATIGDAERYALVDVRRLGDDVRLDYVPVARGGA
jgi:diaminohydroxyphosphoribosylaminopyrimidine deaminase/5-amino-6-(5-phosphoribosylamino)uracil reductase